MLAEHTEHAWQPVAPEPQKFSSQMQSLMSSEAATDVLLSGQVTGVMVAWPQNWSGGHGLQMVSDTDVQADV